MNQQKVSVPSGDLLFFNSLYDIVEDGVYEFPSPPETSYFLILKLAMKS